jgi:hypothetical protein
VPARLASGAGRRGPFFGRPSRFELAVFEGLIMSDRAALPPARRPANISKKNRGGRPHEGAPPRPTTNPNRNTLTILSETSRRGAIIEPWKTSKN